MFCKRIPRHWLEIPPLYLQYTAWLCCTVSIDSESAESKWQAVRCSSSKQQSSHAALLMINSSLWIYLLFSSQSAKHCWVIGSKMWGFAAFLPLLWLYTEYFGVLNCWLDKGNFNMSPLALGNCNELLSTFYFTTWWI